MVLKQLFDKRYLYLRILRIQTVANWDIKRQESGDADKLVHLLSSVV